MDILKYENIEVQGELAYRMIKDFARLEELNYRPNKIFEMGTDSWPGDWEGRTLLAWVLLSRATKREPAYLKAVEDAMEGFQNEKKYFNKIMDDNVNEQQLSGHNWYLRYLLEAYLWKKDKKYAVKAKELVENLYLPTIGKFRKYPTSPELRSLTGRASGEIQGEAVNGWYLSTDIGCAYMSLDALSQYYEIFKDERVEELLDEMIETFLKIDFVKCHMQTHASLSASRGIIRYYFCTGCKELLQSVIKFFDLYLVAGMTENYSNFNWFGRPEWTEPCAIVDSYLLSIELFRATEDEKYARIANRIFYNGIEHAQRENGGFGCDTCVGGGGKEDTLTTHAGYYEAYWCCSMRGGAGLAKVAAQSVLLDQNRMIFMNYIPVKYTSNEICFSVDTTYPIEGDVEIRIEKIRQPMELELYLPEGVLQEQIQASYKETSSMEDSNDICEGNIVNGFLKMHILKEGTLKLHFSLSLYTKPAISPDLCEKFITLWHGDLMLGVKTEVSSKERYCLDQKQLYQMEYLGNGKYQVKDYLLEPINNSIYRSREDMLEYQYQITYEKVK